MYTLAAIMFIILPESLNSRKFSFSTHQENNEMVIFPWIGVLKVQRGNAEALTRLVLISDRKAIGNANEISKLDKETLRKFSTAMFFEDNVPWNCNVTDYVLHPEFYDKTYNTIALVNLNSKREKWFPIQLPMHNMNETNVYAIGLTDEKSRRLEQSIFRMIPVNGSACTIFYKSEGLDIKSQRPKHMTCYKAADIKRRCVFDSGMALAVNIGGNWILTGLGILGPGCQLPSRYIQMLPYVPWLQFHMRGRQNMRRQSSMQSRSTAIDPSKDIVSDVHGNEDDFYVDKLNDATMALRPVYANVREQAYGNCLFDAGVMMYRDAGIVRAPGLTATAVYALSLYDLHYYKVSCVMVSVKCRSRSITKFWYEKGFRSDDFAQFIKVVPHPKEGGGIPPKVLFLTDHYHQYDNITTANIVFKFEFQNEATINVDFFGKPVTTSPAITTTTPKIRTRRTFPRH